MRLARRMGLRGTAGEVALLGVFAIVLVAGSATAASREAPARRPVDLIGWLLILGAFAAVLLRHRWPRSTTLGASLAVGLFIALGYPYGPVYFAAAITAYALAVNSLPRAAMPSLLAAVAILVLTQVRPAPAFRLLVHVSVLLLIALAWVAVPAWLGYTVQLWRRHAADVSERRRQADLATGERARRAAVEERLRLSREVHDIVAHSLSMISLQAGAALHVINQQPEQAQAALQTIRRSSREALRELREVLGSGTAARAPVDGIPMLVQRLSCDQLRLSYDVEGSPRVLPAEVAGCVYRIAQEALTNVVRHAGASTARIWLRYRDDGVVIEVHDDGRGEGTAADPAGRGIPGMRERAAALGGFVETGSTGTGGFRVFAWLPTGSAG